MSTDGKWSQDITKLSNVNVLFNEKAVGEFEDKFVETIQEESRKKKKGERVKHSPSFR